MMATDCEIEAAADFNSTYRDGFMSREMLEGCVVLFV